MKKFKTFVINTVILSIASLIMNIVGMGFSVYISNKIGTEALGVYQLIISIYNGLLNCNNVDSILLKTSLYVLISIFSPPLWLFVEVQYQPQII